MHSPHVLLAEVLVGLDAQLRRCCPCRQNRCVTISRPYQDAVPGMSAKYDCHKTSGRDESALGYVETNNPCLGKSETVAALC